MLKVEDYYDREMDSYGDGDVPEVDVEPYRNGSWDTTVEPLPESDRERRDGPGGE